MNNQIIKILILNLILFICHIAIIYIQYRIYVWDIFEGYIDGELIYKKATTRGLIYLNHPELLDSIHGNSYNVNEYMITDPNQ